ncbi:MAG TPA: metallopeptidase TldD-related protein [Ktedonobacterales bacterium]|nr:metallopeptidase TldD-related protein [Ktedonobacterales bacterium]
MTRPTDPLETVALALERQSGVSDWQARKTTEHSAQLFLIGAQTETRRLVHTEQLQARIYNDHPSRTQMSISTYEPEEARAREPDGLKTRSLDDALAGSSQMARGATSRVLLPEEVANQARLQQALEEAVFIAGLTDNPPYSLPKPPIAGFPAVETVDLALAGSDQARLSALDILRERLLAAVAAEPGIRLSSAELFATASDITLRNSRGILASRQETEVFCDLVLLASDGTQTGEYHAMPQRRRLADLPLEEIVARSAHRARDSLRVSLTPTHQGPVVISGEALIDLFTPLIFHTSARAAYQAMSRFTPGTAICGDAQIRGDRLTFISNALLSYGLASASFSDEGIPGERVVLIQDHHLRAWWAEQRYAAYLNIPPTGSFANIEIPPGSHPVHELLADEEPVYHLVDFSWLNPDELTGDFVAEIKLGYRLEQGQITPIKGGSLSGNLFEALAQTRLSLEMQSTGSYLGPQALRFERLTIAGA